MVHVHLVYAYEQFEHVGGESGVFSHFFAKPNGLCWKMSLNMSNLIGELHWINQRHEIVST